MNRRNFVGTLLAATAGFTILPGAGRIWKALDNRCIPNPEYYSCPFEEVFMMDSEVYSAWTDLLKARQWSGGMGEIIRIGPPPLTEPKNS